MDTSIKKRVFIIGAPRSGTTLLQSILATHSEVTSFPETHYFNHLFSGRRLLSMFGIASPQARRYWNKFLLLVAADKKNNKIPPLTIFTNQYTQQFVHVLDNITYNQNKNIWIEKTPGHLHSIPYLEHAIGDVFFIHILRCGTDVVASLFEFGQKYDDVWGLELRSLDRCIEIWSQDIRISLKYINRNNHFIVKYEHLTENPRKMVVKLCEFLEIPYEEEMITNYSLSASKYIYNEPWKESVKEPIRLLHGHKFNTIFSPQEQQYILNQLPQDIDYDHILK